MESDNSNGQQNLKWFGGELKYGEGGARERKEKVAGSGIYKAWQAKALFGWVRLCLTGYTAPWASQPLDSPRSTRRQAPPPRGQPQTEPPHPRAHLGCHGGLRARCHRPSGAPPPWSGLRGPGPEWVQGVSGEQGAPIRSHIGPRAPAHTPPACRPTCLRLRLAQSSSVCAASSLPWRRYRAPKLRRVVLTVGLRTGSRAVSDSVHPGIRAHPDTQPPLAPRSLWPTKMEPLWRAGPWLTLCRHTHTHSHTNTH